MTTSTITLQVDDLRLKKRLNTLVKRSSDLSPAFKTIAHRFRESRKTIFSQRTKGKYPDFKRGGPNSPYAKAKQRAVGFKYPLLVKYGSLRSSIVNKSDPDNITKIGRKSFVLGTSVPYGVYHDSKLPRKKIPYRPFMFWGSEVPARFRNCLLYTYLSPRDS